MKATKLCIIFFALVIFVAACSQTASTPNTANATTNANKAVVTTPAQPAATVDELATSKELYAKNCMVCHKDTGKGGKVTVEGKTLDPVDLTSDKMKARTDDKLAKQISEGSPDDGMPAFKGKLSADEINSLVKYMRSLQTK